MVEKDAKVEKVKKSIKYTTLMVSRDLKSRMDEMRRAKGLTTYVELIEYLMKK